jgi:hypothetical protein
MAIKIQSNTVVDDNRIFFPLNTAEKRETPTISGGTLTLNLNTATVFDVTLNANITTLTLANIQSSGLTSSFVLVFTADGTARTVVWPVSFRWSSGGSCGGGGGSAPTLSSENGKKDVFVFFTTDGGTNWQAFVSGQSI